MDKLHAVAAVNRLRKAGWELTFNAASNVIGARIGRTLRFVAYTDASRTMVRARDVVNLEVDARRINGR